MEKHTPGPWDVYIGEDRDVISVSKWIDWPNGGKMAISLARLPVPKKYLSQEEINANGYLMRAAPEMREALKGMIEPWASMSDQVLEEHFAAFGGPEGVKLKILAARAALASANGEPK